MQWYQYYAIANTVINSTITKKLAICLQAFFGLMIFSLASYHTVLFCSVYENCCMKKALLDIWGQCSTRSNCSYMCTRVWEVYCWLISQLDHFTESAQSNYRCAGWSGASLSAYIWRPIFALWVTHISYLFLKTCCVAPDHIVQENQNN